MFWSDCWCAARPLKLVEYDKNVLLHILCRKTQYSFLDRDDHVVSKTVYLLSYINTRVCNDKTPFSLQKIGAFQLYKPTAKERLKRLSRSAKTL